MIDQRREPIVMDFGLACTLDGEDARTTGSGFAVGSPPYMSPERVEGRTDIGPETDIYSLGAVLYELLAGRPPFRGSALSVLHQVSHSDPPRLLELRPDLSPEIVSICGRAMARRPSDRFASMSGFADALGAFLFEHPTPGGSVQGLARSAELETPPAGLRVVGPAASTPPVGVPSPPSAPRRTALPAPWLLGVGAVGGALAVLAIVAAGQREPVHDVERASREHPPTTAAHSLVAPGDDRAARDRDGPRRQDKAQQSAPLPGPARGLEPRPLPEFGGPPPPRDDDRPPPRERFPSDWGFVDYDRDGDDILRTHELPPHIIHRADGNGDEELTAEEFEAARERMGRALFAPPEHPSERGHPGRRPPPRGPRGEGRPPP
jgi:hypothetical protein